MRTVVVLALACFGLGTAADARHLHLRKPRRGFQMRMTPLVIPPGGDREGCEYLVAPNHGPMDVSAFEPLVGCHGGLGGWQDTATLLCPTELLDDRLASGEPIIGADVLHQELVAILERLGHRRNLEPARAAT